jgi:hypothetical protein
MLESEGCPFVRCFLALFLALHERLADSNVSTSCRLELRASGMVCAVLSAHFQSSS